MIEIENLTENIEKDSIIVLNDLISGNYNIKDINDLYNYVETRKKQKVYKVYDDYLKSIFEELEINDLISSNKNPLIVEYVDGDWRLNPIVITEKGRSKIKTYSKIKDSSVYQTVKTVKDIIK